MYRNFPSIFIVAALFMASSYAGQAEAAKAEFHLDTTAPVAAKVQVDSRWLDVDVMTLAGDEVTIKADFVIKRLGSQEAADKCVEKEKVVIEQEGDALVVRQVKKSFHKSCGRKLEGKMVLGIPARIPVSIDTASGDVTFSGDRNGAPVVIDVASGDVDFDGATSSLKIDSSSGEVTVRVSRPLETFEADVASGGIDLVGGARAAKVSIASGDVSLANLQGSVKARAASGDIELAWDVFPRGSQINASAASGDLTLTLPKGTTLDGKVSTWSGTIRSDLLGRPGESRHDFALEGRDGQVALETASGDISIFSR